MHLGYWIPRVAIVLVLVSIPGVRGDELDTFLESQERLLGDESVPAGERAGVAMGMAAALDRAAGRARTVEERRGRWKRGAEILDRFSRAHPNVPESRELQAQAAVFEWAIGASWLHQAGLTPIDPAPRKRAVEALDGAIGRMQMLVSASEDKRAPLARQMRIRLARALLDRANLEPEGSRTAKERFQQALEVLEDTEELGGLAGIGGIEKARALLGLDRADEAQEEVDRIVKNPANVPESEWIDVRVRTLLERGRFSEAETVLGSRPQSPGIHRLRLELALDRWGAARKEEDEKARKSAEESAFVEVRALQEGGGDLAIEALLRLSEGLTEPSEDLSPEDLDLLASGRVRAGRPEEASRLEVRASEAAKARGEDEKAAAYRLRAAGILLRAKHRVQARHLLDCVVDDESAGAMRSKAALLGALSMRSEGALRPSEEKGYEEALRGVVDRFPKSPEAGESLWLLGLMRRGQDDPTGASEFWEKVPEAHRRWLEAQVSRADLRIDAIESALIQGDRRSAEQERLEAREALDQVESKVTTDAERAEVVLTRARLETVSNLGDPKRAVDDLDRLMAQPLEPDQRGRAERLRVLALLELGRSVDAMRATRALVESSDSGGLLELARRLDQSASTAPSDLLMRRFGEIQRLVASHLVEHPDGLSEPQRAEARLRLLRGQVFHGDSGAAREGLKAWPGALDELPVEVQPDLARLALDADDPERALEVNRSILKRQPTGTRVWYQARLGEAEALVSLRELEKARRVLVATATLHPDFGGERLHRRYEALLEQIEREQAFRSSPRP